MKKGLKALGVLTCLAGSLLGSAFTSHAETPVDVRVDGKPLDQPPVIDGENRAWVPVRAVSSALRINDVQWDADAQKVTINYPSRKIEIVVGQPEIQINGQTLAMDTMAKVIDGRVMIPARYLGKALEAAVYWDEYPDSDSVAIERKIVRVLG